MFSEVKSVPPGEYLVITLREHFPLVTAINIEKACSELVIMPVLVKVRRQLQYQVSIFSGSEFNISAEKELEGCCDFILSRSSEQHDITSPVVTIVEAKNESIKSGLGHCIATMIAAYLFNQNQGVAIDTVYGAVTSDTD